MSDPVTYTGVLPIGEHTAVHLSTLLAGQRRDRGTRRGRRALGPWRHAVLVLRWFLDATRVAQLAVDNAISSSTAYRYLHEGIDALAATAPGLHGALLAGHTHLQGAGVEDVAAVLGQVGDDSRIWGGRRGRERLHRVVGRGRGVVVSWSASTAPDEQRSGWQNAAGERTCHGACLVKIRSDSPYRSGAQELSVPLLARREIRSSQRWKTLIDDLAWGHIGGTRARKTAVDAGKRPETLPRSTAVSPPTAQVSGTPDQTS